MRSVKGQGTILIKWVRSGIGFDYRQEEMVRSLGLRRLNQVVERLDNPHTRGLVAKVAHLVEIVGEASRPAWADVPEYRISPPEVTEVAPVTAPQSQPEEDAQATEASGQEAKAAQAAEGSTQEGSPAPAKAGKQATKRGAAAKSEITEAPKGKSASLGAKPRSAAKKREKKKG